MYFTSSKMLKHFVVVAFIGQQAGLRLDLRQNALRGGIRSGCAG